jgi:antirestriction protein ArdC
MNTMTTATLTKNPTTDKAAELQQQLVERIEALTTTDDWKAMLDTAAKFHNYSFSNVMLIGWQRPDATRVAGFKTWQSLGRQVRKGEKAIRILAPLLVNKTDTDEVTGEEKTRKQLIGFRSVPVFDIAQTDGDPLPEVMPTRLTGDGNGYALDLSMAVAAQIEAAGYRIAWDGTDWPATLNGVTDFAAKTVTLREGLDPAQEAKTLTHELAHVLLHEPVPGEARHHRGTGEVEAESVAYVVAQSLGMDTADYSLPYVAHWAKGDVKEVRSTGQRVIATAHAILDGMPA